MNFTPSPLNARQFCSATLTVLFALGCGDTLDNAVNDATGGGSDAFSQIYQSDTFQQCSNCHSADGPARTADVEKTEDWSTRDKAYSSLKGKASGMIGNFSGCNGVSFIGATAAQSLLVAALDSSTRASFQSAEAPDCTGDAISDQNLKLSGPIPGTLLQQLKAWIDSGAPDK